MRSFQCCDIQALNIGWKLVQLCSQIRKLGLRDADQLGLVALLNNPLPFLVEVSVINCTQLSHNPLTSLKEALTLPSSLADPDSLNPDPDIRFAPGEVV